MRFWGAQATADPRVGAGGVPGVPADAWQWPSSIRVPVGSLGLCRDQQVGSHRVSAQSQPKVFQSLPTPVCRDCEEGEEESWLSEATKLILPSVTEEGAVSFLSSDGMDHWGTRCITSLCSFSLWWCGNKSLFFMNFSNVFSQLKP